MPVIAPNFEDLELLGRAEQVTRRPELQVNEGDISEMLIRAAAAMADKCIEFGSSSFRNTYLDGAEGDALTELASDHWGIDRLAAVVSTGEVTFTRTTTGAGTIFAGTVVATVADPDGTAYRFVTDVDLVFAVPDLSKSVAVTAEAAGRDSNVAAGTITRIIDNLFDSFTVTNAATTAGGAEEESDEELRERTRTFPSTIRRGTLAALEFGAKQVPSVKVATAIENEITGEVIVYVSDIDGNSSAQMVTEADEELLNWRCAGSLVSAAGGLLVLQDIDYSITVRPGTDVAALEPLIAEALEGTVRKLGVEEILFRSSLQTAIQNIDLDAITDAVINTPAADVQPGTGELLRAGVITRT